MILKCQVQGTRWAPPIVLDIDFVLNCALKHVPFSSKFMSLKKMLSPSKPAFPSPFSISYPRKRILTIKLARPLQSLILTITQPQQKSSFCKSLRKKVHHQVPGDKRGGAAVHLILGTVPGDAGEVRQVGVHLEHVPTLHDHPETPTSAKRYDFYHCKYLLQMFLTLASLPS